MSSMEEVTMTYSAILRNAKGERVVRVNFERPGLKGKDYAEAILPDAVIEKSEGFHDDELSQLAEYLKENGPDIMAKAKTISNPLKWFS